MFLFLFLENMTLKPKFAFNSIISWRTTSNHHLLIKYLMPKALFTPDTVITLTCLCSNTACSDVDECAKYNIIFMLKSMSIIKTVHELSCNFSSAHPQQSVIIPNFMKVPLRTGVEISLGQ